MEVKTFAISGPVLLHPKKLEDARGFFSEVYNESLFNSLIGKHSFIQDNFSLSRDEGVVRGLHFQSPPFAQGKLVHVTRGAVFDVAVDIRRSSPTYGKFVSAILSADNWAQFWVPTGFAHGFCTLQRDCEVTYKVTEFYSPAHDFGLAWDDPELGIVWPVSKEKAALSERDKTHPILKDLPPYFP